MFLPIGDENPRERTPYVNYALLTINIAVFVIFTFPQPLEPVLAVFALRPKLVLTEWNFETLKTLITSMFLHGDPFHLIGNMLFLWIFGDNVEDKLGHVAYTIFYLVCGLAASFLHIATNAESMIYTLGASGAISGVVGAYVVFFPRHNIRMLLWIYFFVQIVRIPAFWWIGFWFALQIVNGLRDLAGVAHWAHVGGFLAGLLVAAPWKYLLFPRRFGLHGADEPYPGELIAASRTSERPVAVRRPFVTVEPEGIEFVEEEHSRYAVLRASDELAHVSRIADAVHASGGIPPAATARRLHASRGTIARQVDRVTAERIQAALRHAGVPTLVVPDDGSTQPPAPVLPDSVAWNELQVGYLHRGELVRVPWGTPFLYVAACVHRRPFIDIFVTRRARVRATEETPLRFVDAVQRTERATGLRALAGDILARRRGAALNDGVRVLAGGGSWGWLAFQDPADYDDYAFWAYNVILARQSLHRF